MSVPLLARPLAGAATALLLVLLPLFASDMYVYRGTEVLVFALFAVSFNILLGSAGLLPFGHAAFFGVGAYAAALIFKHFPETPLFVTLAAAVFCALLAASIIGLFCVRLKAAYFALISLSFQMFLYAVAVKWRTLTYGDDGLTITRPDLHLPVLGTVSLASGDNLYWLTLGAVTLGIAVCYCFLKTPLGNALVATREKDVRAAFLGYNVYLTRYAAFLVAGLTAGLAGALFVLFQEFISASCLNVNTSMTAVFMAVIGGFGSFVGPIIGSAFYILFQDWVSSLTKHWWILMGIVFIVIVMYLNGGLVSLLRLKGASLQAAPRGDT